MMMFALGFVTGLMLLAFAVYVLLGPLSFIWWPRR
jgi:hypothetical protein